MKWMSSRQLLHYSDVSSSSLPLERGNIDPFGQLLHGCLADKFQVWNEIFSISSFAEASANELLTLVPGFRQSSHCQCHSYWWACRGSSWNYGENGKTNIAGRKMSTTLVYAHKKSQIITLRSFRWSWRVLWKRTYSIFVIEWSFLLHIFFESYELIRLMAAVRTTASFLFRQKHNNMVARLIAFADFHKKWPSTYA